MNSESEYLTLKYQGVKWDELCKDFPRHNVMSHTVRYNNQNYICSCDRFDVCKKFFLLMDEK